ncbi:MAG TPA: MucR family transcriptional regulator [Bryobacteraceae bacterium]|jgi:predicted transcriptional regulator|nr:MucR family transcriptional regulator [Bryobacteraceae bacterium]
MEQFYERTRFHTVDQVNTYLSGPTIECLLCGKQMQSLSSHISRTHKMEPIAYQLKFGIPFERSLVSATLLHRLKEVNTPSVMRQMFLQRMRRHKKNKPPAPKRPKRLPEPLLDLEEKPREYRFLGKQAVINRPFETEEEVDAYLSNNRIRCLICGKLMQCLGTHLRLVHRTTPDEYRSEFGIPAKRPLWSAASLSAWPHARERKAPKPMVRMRRLSLRGRPNPVPHVTTNCPDCGKAFVTTMSQAKKGLRCVDCISPSARRARLAYWQTRHLKINYIPPVID